MEMPSRAFADIHTHILPHVDDGAQTMEQSLELIRRAWEDGIRIIILTPHYRRDYKKHTPEELRQIFEELQQKTAENYPELRLYLGQEVYYEMDVPEQLSGGRILSLNGSDYVLIEFRRQTTRSQIIFAVSEVIRYGWIPIVAHIERYDCMRKDASLVDELLDMGALMQLNADSVMGIQGFQVKRFCHRLLKQEKIQFIASDTHNATARPPELRKCFLFVQKKYGAAYATQIFYENAQIVLKNGEF